MFNFRTLNRWFHIKFSEDFSIYSEFDVPCTQNCGSQMGKTLPNKTSQFIHGLFLKIGFVSSPSGLLKQEVMLDADILIFNSPLKSNDKE